MKKLHRVVLIDLAKPHKHVADAKKELAELQSLVQTFGATDVIRIIQHRTKPDKATFIGSGKVLELEEIVERERISHVILNAIVNHTQLFHLTERLWNVNPSIQVWDRADLILNIFEKHALTAEAKLEIEIARMEHMGPRIFGLGGSFFSRQGGGIGTRGVGQTNIELMKRHWKVQIKRKKEILEKLAQNKLQQLERRRKNGMKSVSIIGYTNAGKTSLFNLLTKKRRTVENALFVTLESVSGKLHLPFTNIPATVSDTIGFIKNLPNTLIDSFKSTLMESVHADLLLHVVDATDEKIFEKIEVVEKILDELNIPKKKQIYVFNKIDKLNGQRTLMVNQLKSQFSSYSPQFISVSSEEGLDTLRNFLRKTLSSGDII